MQSYPYHVNLWLAMDNRSVLLWGTCVDGGGAMCTQRLEDQLGHGPLGAVDFLLETASFIGLLY